MSWDSLDPGLKVGLILLAVIQVTLVVAALRLLVRTSNERVAWLPRAAWAALILLFQPIGAIVFLFAGRTPAPAQDPAHAAPDERPARDAVVNRALDTLYAPQGHAEDQAADHTTTDRS